MNIFKKLFGAIRFVPKTIFEASQEGAKFLNDALVNAEGKESVDDAQRALVDLICMALASQGVTTSDVQKSRAKEITVDSFNKANPEVRKVLTWYSNIGE